MDHLIKHSIGFKLTKTEHILLLTRVSAGEIWYVPFIVTRFPFHVRRGFKNVVISCTLRQKTENVGASIWTPIGARIDDFPILAKVGSTKIRVWRN